MADLQYPDDLNPFGSDEEGETEPSHQQQQPPEDQSTAKIDEYPDHLSPFADEEDETKPQVPLCDDNYDNSLNPFAEEDEEIDRLSPTPKPEPVDSPPVPLPRTKSLLKKELALKNKQIAPTVSPNGLPTVQAHRSDPEQLSSVPSITSKLSKITTLLPKGDTFKSTIKIKPRRIFKKYDSR